MAATADHQVVEIDREILRGRPMPQPQGETDKDERGRVLVVGGEREIAGSVALAALAAFRAGAGKVRVAVPRSAAAVVATIVPESRIYHLSEHDHGAIATRDTERLDHALEMTDALVIGPGTADDRAAEEIAAHLLERAKTQRILLDAAAIGLVARRRDLVSMVAGRLVITPHSGEMASLLGRTREEIVADRRSAALEAAERFGCVVVMKGGDTWIADGGDLSTIYVNRRGNSGLGISCSGDVLSGIIAGHLARGASRLNAACRGVHIHAIAGEELARTIGPLGYLAREILPLVPGIMAGIEPDSVRESDRIDEHPGL